MVIISPGGQVYDRTTGTWAGENRGSVGDTLNRPDDGNVKVWRDAEGITGLQVFRSSTGGGGSGPAAGHVNNGVGSGVGGAGSGPGSPYVTTGDLSRRLASSLSQRGKEQGTVFFDDPGPYLDVWEAAPVTPMMIGGVPFIHDRGWSDAGQAEERWGEGELLSPTWFYQWGVAIADQWANTTQRYLDSPWSGVSQDQREANARAIGTVAGSVGAFLWSPTPALQDGRLPPQEPVDWGR